MRFIGDQVSLDHKFWKGKKVFLTGHTGFKGSWLTLWLQSWGASVTGYSLAPHTDPSLFHDADIAGCLTNSIIANICDGEILTAAIRIAAPEIVIHMAAQPIVLQSYRDPVETYAVNVMGTVNLLQACRSVDTIRAIVIVTSDKCYESRGWSWGYREDDILNGNDPYSNSKSCAELVASSFRKAFFNPKKFDEHGVTIATVRAGNVIGGGDWSAHRLVPDIVRSLRTGQSPLIRNRHAIRPWQHVLEPLSGYLRLIMAMHNSGPAYGEAWNFGPLDANAQCVGWVADRLTELWSGTSQWYDGNTGSAPHEDLVLHLDSSKARDRLGWRPRWVIDRTLEEVIKGYRAFDTRRSVQSVMLEQISAYLGSD